MTIMKKIFNIMLLLSVVVAGCKDDWDDFYGSENDDRSAGGDRSIMELLESRPAYSKFVQLLNETGIDKVVSSDRVLTVWVPANRFITDEIMELDSIDKRRFVLNHMNPLALYRIKLATKSELETLAGKYVQIARSNNNTTIEKMRVSRFDQACTNGVVHEIEGVLMPLKNVMEFLLECGDEYSIFRDSILSYNDTLFRPDLSYALGVDTVGQTLYDSVFDINNTLTKNVKFGDEKGHCTLFLPSNDVIKEMIEDLGTYFEALGMQPTASDTLKAYEFILKGSFVGSEMPNLTGLKSVNTAGGMKLRFDKQLISTDYDQCSNGVVYKFEKAYVPRGQFMTKVDYQLPYLFELPEEEWTNYYHMSNGRVLIDSVSTGDLTVDTAACLQMDSRYPSPDRICMVMRMEKGEYAEFTILQKTLKGEIKPAKLMPGKYSVKAQGNSWTGGNMMFYIDNNLQNYSSSDEASEAFRGGTVIPMGQRGVFGVEGGIKIMCDTVEIGVYPGNNVIKIEATGTGGGPVNLIKVGRLLFEPVGDNY